MVLQNEVVVDKKPENPTIKIATYIERQNAILREATNCVWVEAYRSGGRSPSMSGSGPGFF